ncbi:MAG: hypothetical protein WEC83_01615 [Patescibacteria group bacterium]
MRILHTLSLILCAGCSTSTPQQQTFVERFDQAVLNKSGTPQLDKGVEMILDYLTEKANQPISSVCLNGKTTPSIDNFAHGLWVFKESAEDGWPAARSQMLFRMREPNTALTLLEDLEFFKFLRSFFGSDKSERDRLINFLDKVEDVQAAEIIMPIPEGGRRVRWILFFRQTESGECRLIETVPYFNFTAPAYAGVFLFSVPSTHCISNTFLVG